MIPKFRAWEGGTASRMYPTEEVMLFNGSIWIPDEGSDTHEWVENNDLELMQSTGLKDKNGQEIFEGDVVQFEDCYTESDFLYINKGIVEWSQGSFTVTNRDSVEMEDLLDGEILDVTIIGNIHENQDIVEVADDQ